MGELLKDLPNLVKLSISEFKERPRIGDPIGVKLGLTSEQKPTRKSKWDTTDKEKLDNLYKKVENSAFTGKISVSYLKLKAEELGLDVAHYRFRY